MGGHIPQVPFPFTWDYLHAAALQLRSSPLDHFRGTACILILASVLRPRYDPGMILPEIKRVVRFEAMTGKTIQSVEERMDTIRLIFTDGTFADLEPDTSSKIIVQRARSTRREKREWRERRG